MIQKLHSKISLAKAYLKKWLYFDRTNLYHFKIIRKFLTGNHKIRFYLQETIFVFGIEMELQDEIGFENGPFQLNLFCDFRSLGDENLKSNTGNFKLGLKLSGNNCTFAQFFELKDESAFEHGPFSDL